jgi:hypothetical protein
MVIGRILANITDKWRSSAEHFDIRYLYCQEHFGSLYDIGQGSHFMNRAIDRDFYCG